MERARTPRRQASILRPWPSCAERFSASPFGPKQRAVGEDAVDVENHEADAARFVERLLGNLAQITLAEEVVHVERAHQHALLVQHEHLADLVLLHDVHRPQR